MADHPDSSDNSIAVLVPVHRLSVVIPVLGPSPIDRTPERGLAERAIQSVLDQADPVGTEVIAIAEGDGADLLREAFRDRPARLEIIQVPQSSPIPGIGGDRFRLANLGAARSRGSFLAFLDPRDTWLPGRLTELEPHLKSHDLIVSTDQHPGESSDWVRAFLRENWATPSSIVIRRALFETVGGFPEVYGEAEYELILKSVTALQQADNRERFHVLHGASRQIQNGQREGLFPPPIENSLNKLRSAATLVAMVPKVPARYWGTLVKRLLGR